MEFDALLRLIDRFVAGENRSIVAANEIEVALDDDFPDDEFIQDTVLMLASYRPGGGEFLYDDEQMADRLSAVAKRLRCQDAKLVD